jgi:hypothetical protein
MLRITLLAAGFVIGEAAFFLHYCCLSQYCLASALHEPHPSAMLLYVWLYCDMCPQTHQ